MKNFFKQINTTQDILPIIDSLFGDGERGGVPFEAQKQLLFALSNYLFCVAPRHEQNLFILTDLLHNMKNWVNNEKSVTDLLITPIEITSIENKKDTIDTSDIISAYTNAKKLAGKDLSIIIDKCLKFFHPITGDFIAPSADDEIISLADAIIENFGRRFEQDILPMELERDFIISVVAFVYYTGNEYNENFFKKLDIFYARLQNKNPFYDYYKKFNEAKKIDDAAKFIFNQYFSFFYDIDDIDSGLFKKIVGETKKILLDTNGKETGHFSRGELYKKVTEYELATVDYSEYIKTHDKDSLAYLNRAWCYFKLGKYDEAIRDHNKAIEFNPEPPAFYFYEKAHVLYEIKEYKKALIDLDSAIMADSHYCKAYNLKAVIWEILEIENYAELALESYTEAIRLSKRRATDRAVYYYNRAKNYFHYSKNVDKAFEDCKKAMELNPNDICTGEAYEIIRLEFKKHPTYPL